MYLCYGLLKVPNGVEPVCVILDCKDDFEKTFKNSPEFFVLALFEDGMMKKILYRANAKTYYGG